MAFSPANRSRLHAAIACLVTGLLWWRTRESTLAVIWAAALVLLVLACVAPRWYAPVQRGFDSVARLLTAAVTWVVLGLVYFLVFTPLRLWNGILRRDPLGSRSSAKASFLKEYPSKSLGQFERQY